MTPPVRGDHRGVDYARLIDQRLVVGAPAPARAQRVFTRSLRHRAGHVSDAVVDDAVDLGRSARRASSRARSRSSRPGRSTTSTTRSSGFMCPSIARDDARAALAPGISTAPTTTSAEHLLLDRRDAWRSAMRTRPWNSSSSWRRRGSDRSRIVTSASSPAMRAAMPTTPPPMAAPPAPAACPARRHRQALLPRACAGTSPSSIASARRPLLHRRQRTGGGRRGRSPVTDA